MSDLSTKRLDFGWWANNGPTAGYLVRLTLEAAAHAVPADSDTDVRHVSLHLLSLPPVGPFESVVSARPGPDGTGVVSVTFAQSRLFAVASLSLGSNQGESGPGDASPPPVLPPEAYRPMIMSSLVVPPVTSHFEYRPVFEMDGPGPREGWDLVWVTPLDERLRGQALVASMIDSWYPPSFMRSVRVHLGSGRPLSQPAPPVLTAVTVSFTAEQNEYDHVHDALLANQIAATTDGYCFERSEVWSDDGVLLANAELVRRSHPGRRDAVSMAG